MTLKQKPKLRKTEPMNMWSKQSYTKNKDLKKIVFSIVEPIKKVKVTFYKTEKYNILLKNTISFPIAGF